jgi:hypothetical protein
MKSFLDQYPSTGYLRDFKYPVHSYTIYNFDVAKVLNSLILKYAMPRVKIQTKKIRDYVSLKSVYIQIQCIKGRVQICSRHNPLATYSSGEFARRYSRRQMFRNWLNIRSFITESIVKLWSTKDM